MVCDVRGQNVCRTCVTMLGNITQPVILIDLLRSAHVNKASLGKLQLQPYQFTTIFHETLA